MMAQKLANKTIIPLKEINPKGIKTSASILYFLFKYKLIPVIKMAIKTMSGETNVACANKVGSRNTNKELNNNT